MNAIIIEDEKPAARQLERMLSRMEVSVGACLSSVAQAISWFGSYPHPDVIFLDIQLSDGLSFEIFEVVQVKSPIVFTTAYDEYALQAFKLNSIDYLLKPIDEDELRAAVRKYKQFGPGSGRISVDFEDIKKLLANPLEREYRKRFTVRVGQHLKIINADEVECFFSRDKATFASMADGRSYALDTTLERLENELDPKCFFRVSRNCSVNLRYIVDIVSYTNSRLVIRLKRFREMEVIVSRDRVADFKIWLE